VTDLLIGVRNGKKIGMKLSIAQSAARLIKIKTWLLGKVSEWHKPLKLDCSIRHKNGVSFQSRRAPL
jgi:hypothetical protein